jgi:predicted transcriptional regulator
MIDKAELIKLYNQHPRLTYKEISEKLGIKLGSLGNHLYHLQAMHEIESRGETGKFRLMVEGEARLNRIEDLLKAGSTWQEVGSDLKLTPHWVKTYVGRYRPALFEIRDKTYD